MATFTSKITESITLSSGTVDSTKTLSIGSIDNVYKRTVTCPASVNTIIANFGATVGTSAGGLDVGDVKYIRITNLEASNSVELGFISAGTNFQVLLQAGHSYVIGSPEAYLLAEEDTDPSFGTMADLVTIEATGGGNAILLEIMIAST